MTETAAHIEVKFKKLDSSVEPSVLSYLRGHGWDLQHSKLAADAKAGKLVKRDGFFWVKDIKTYAKTWCKISTTKAPEENTANYREDVQREHARKLRLQNDEREGSLIQRSLVEQELSARLAFLKRDLMNLGPRAIDTLMESFSTLAKGQGLDIDGVNLLSLVSDLEAFWSKNMAGYLDSYARPRGFLPEDVYQKQETDAV